ncbi:unnamed protein product, partial [Polarella glacialis]
MAVIGMLMQSFAPARPAPALQSVRRSWLLFTLLLQLLQEGVVAPVASGLPPTRVTSAEGSLTLNVAAPNEAAECEVFRDNGIGDESNVQVYRGPCGQSFVVTGLVADRNYQFQSRGIDSDGNGGERSTIVNFVSAGVPEWQGVIPTIDKVGTENVKVSWQTAANGGSPILGYHIDMEANGDGSWERIYDGTNKPSKLDFTATGLHASLT